MRLRWPAVLRHAPRNADFGELQETFLVTAIATILVIRTQLWITNYPQLGGGGLHVAHLLYGGIFMVLAIGLLATYLGRSIRRPAVVIGGVGFGFFIDELGKFITTDNNYFFKPTAALIYLVFVGLFLLTRALQRQRGLSPQERMSNVLDLVGKAAERKLDQSEKKHALELLDGADPGDPLYEPVRRLVEEADVTPAPAPSRLARGAKALGDRYFWLLERPWFRPALVSVFALWALLSISSIVGIVFSLGGGRAGFGSDALSDLNFINVASLASSGASALLVGVGFWCLRRRDRRGAYRMFERALLISIFLTRVFAFVESEFSAVFGLGVDLLLLITLRYGMRQDRRLEPGELPRGGAQEVRQRASRARPA